MNNYMENLKNKLQQSNLKLREISSSADDINVRNRIRPQNINAELNKKVQRLKRLQNTCRELQQENEQLKTNLVKANDTIRSLSDKVRQHELQMQQMTKVINKMRRCNVNIGNRNLVMDTGLKLNTGTADEGNNLELHLEDIEDEEECTVNDMVIKQTTCGQSVDKANVKHNGENIDVLKDLILRLPAEGLKDLEKALKCSEKDLSHYLSQVQRSKARNEFYQNVKDDLILRTDRLLEMKRTLLETVSTVCNKGNNYQKHAMIPASSHLSPVIEERAPVDDEYFQKSLVVPRLDFNPTENRETERINLLVESKRNDFKYLENKGDHVVFKGYSSSYENPRMNPKKTFTDRIQNIAARILNVFSYNKNRKAKASAVRTGNDVITVTSDISVLSKTDVVGKKSEFLVPKLDLSNLESPRRDTSSIPLDVSLSDSGSSCPVSAESRGSAKVSKSTTRPNGKKEKNIFARLRSFVKGKK